MSQQSSDNKYTRGMAEFVAGLQYDAIPPEVRHRLKLLMLDALGCGLYGAQLEWSRILHRTLAKLDQSSSCGIWGTRQRLSAPHAALANGSQVQGFELDDGHRFSGMHVGAPVLPALVAVAETSPGLSGRDFLTAAAAGYEIGPRVGICMTGHLGQGWHPVGTLGVFAAAAAAARALKLDAGRALHALAMAGSQSAGLMAAQYGSMVKRMHAGRAAQSGLYGAVLAEEGYTGISNVFESEYGGYCTTYSGTKDRFKLDELTAGLGANWEIMRVALKFYASVRSSHTTLDAMRQLRKERPFSAQDVEKVVLHMSQVAMHHCGWEYKPEGVTGAQLNAQYCVAVMLLENDVFVDQFSEARLTDPAILALVKKVEPRHDPEMTAKGEKFRQMVRLEIMLKDGTRLERTELFARGMPEAFTDDKDIIDKFEKLARKVLPEKQVIELRDSVLNLEQMKDASRLGRLLTLG